MSDMPKTWVFQLDDREVTPETATRENLLAIIEFLSAERERLVKLQSFTRTLIVPAGTVFDETELRKPGRVEVRPTPAPVRGD